MTAQELIETTKDRIGSIGGAFYFQPETLARGKELGLDGFRFYFLGRGGVLGDVEAPVIASAFGYFQPGLVSKLWNTGRQKVPPAQARAEYLECCRAFGRSRFSELEDLDRFCDAAEVVVAATHPAALALYAGHAAEPLAEDTPARAMQLAATLRELRGSTHLVAVIASGLPPAVAHAIRRPDDVSSFGYQEAPAITDEDRQKLGRADALTDELLLRSYQGLSEDQQDALAAGAAAMAGALG
jgi:hypothetical protein